LQQDVRGKQHSRRTDPALRGTVFDERLLQGRQPSAISQSLDRRDLAALNLTCGYQAAVDDRAVDQHAAGTALTLTAAFFRPRRAEIFAQHVKQTACTDDVERNRSSV